MANPERGEVPLTVNGETYTLKLSMNAAVILQKKTNRKIGQLLADCSNLDFEAIRSLVWMLLQKYHAAKFKTEEQVGELIDEAGGIGLFSDALGDLVKLNAPDPATGEGSDRPPSAQPSGTGDNSTPTLVASV